jgi:hypothetical protein
VNHFEEGKRLRPFRKLTDTAVYVLEAYKRHEENYSAKDSEPQNSRGEVVQDEVLGFETAAGRITIHHHWSREEGCMERLSKSGLLGKREIDPVFWRRIEDSKKRLE